MDAPFGISLLYAGIFGLLLLMLSANVLREWVRSVSQNDEPAGELRLERAAKAQAHFLEYVPIGLIMLALLDANHAPAVILHGLGGALLAARLAHVYGAGREPGANLARLLGTQVTFLVLAVAGFACIYFYGFTSLYRYSGP